MTQTVDGVFDGSVLKPETALALEPNTRVRITVEPIPPAKTAPASFLETARSLRLDGPPDWATNFDKCLCGNDH